MQRLDQEQPIRIVRKKKGHGGHHGGAWKVAYADFVTAMMALFIVLWIVGQSKQVKEYVANYFRDPGAFMTNTKGGGAFENNPAIIGERIGEEHLKRSADSLLLVTKGEEIKRNLAQTPGMARLSDQIETQVVREGLRIELLDKSESFFFDVGTSVLKKDAVEVLKVIAAEVGTLPNRIAIEGHTDSRQYSRQDGYTNFELSAERANSARRILTAHGVAPAHIDEVRGYADTRLRKPDDPFDDTNRRISILVKYANP